MSRVFESCGFEYRVLHPIKYGRDGVPVLLATRGEYLGAGTEPVELRPLHVAPETTTPVRARLSEELQLSGLLRHPHIGEVLGYAVEGERPYLVLEHLPGCSLETVLDASALARRKLSVGFAVTVALAVAEALDHAHHCTDAQGRPLHIVHRAVSPSNIQLTQRGHVKLVNFGSAYSELIGRCRTPTGLLRGEAAYLAPEVLREFQRPRKRRRAAARTPPDARADLFSLGLVLLGQLSGWHPLDPPDSRDEEASSLVLPGTRVETEPAIPLGVLSARLLSFGPSQVERATQRLAPRLRRIIARALQVKPSERYPSARALADELRAYLREDWPHYHPRELAAELAALIRAARSLDEQVAYGVTEPGILCAPVDQPGNAS